MTYSQSSPDAVDVRAMPDEERYRRFGDELDDLKRRSFARVGPEDVAYVRRLDRFSRVMEIAGRVLIHVSPEPVTFTLGVVALFVHKQLQAAEIGHTVLHGTYDALPDAGRFRSKGFWWDLPIDEESWRYGHNVRHHGATNVAGRDADIHFGPVRLTQQTPYLARRHRFQLPFLIGILAPSFTFWQSVHFTGLFDAYFGNGLPTQTDFLPDRSPASVRDAWWKALRKYVPYYAVNYVLFPALAGPMFWKVLLGNWLAEVMRDINCAAMIICSHVGPAVAIYPIGTKPSSRGHWYAMQVEATNDFEVSLPISVLCGGVDLQIEHHLFPTLPPQRLREIAPEVREICVRYGVAYHTDTWGRTLRRALAWVGELGRRGGVRAILDEI